MFSPRCYLSRILSILLIIFTALPHLHVRNVGLIRRPLSFPGALFLRFVLFWLRRCGVGSPWEISISIGSLRASSPVWRARENARARGPSRLRRSLARSRETRFARPNRRICSQAMAPVPELHVSSFKHATWLNFADFCSSGDFVCDIDVLLVLWKTIRLILFIDDSLRVER